ncbi:MAG: hypothetical protein IJ542_03290 [Clostridia bacterium]|nr:hypothetical protein [Clostridia bacterium]
MEKTVQKIKKLFWFYALAMVLALGIIPLAIFVPIVWLKVVLILLVFAANVYLICYAYSKLKKLEKQLEKEIKELEEKKKKTTLLDVYGILGISPQYKQDGTLKDIFELLGIEPQYDEKGNRIETIYELIGINPRFTADGVEIPLVFRIKNRINALVKASAAVPLYYLPRDLLMLGLRPYPMQPLPPEIEGKPKDNGAKKPPIVIKVGSSTKGKTSKPEMPNYPAVAKPAKKPDKKKSGGSKAKGPKKPQTNKKKDYKPHKDNATAFQGAADGGSQKAQNTPEQRNKKTYSRPRITEPPKGSNTLVLGGPINNKIVEERINNANPEEREFSETAKNNLKIATTTTTYANINNSSQEQHINSGPTFE